MGIINMNGGKTIGLSRPIKKEWLDKTAELASQGMDEKSILSELKLFLSFEIESETNLRKTRAILVNTWSRSSDSHPAIWNQAVYAYIKDRTNKTAIHWSMILLSYSVFADICGLIGKISTMQETFRAAWLKERLYDVWGERSTLLYSCEKVLQTVKYLGTIKSEKIGSYKIIKQKVLDNDTIKVMLMVLLVLGKKAYYDVSELSNAPLFFPFEYEVTFELLHHSPEFCLSNFGGKTVVSIGQNSP